MLQPRAKAAIVLAMELFGIAASIPGAFVMIALYRLILLKVVARFRWATTLLRPASFVVLGLFAVEIALLVTLGAVQSRALIGPVFVTGHAIVFFLGTPATGECHPAPKTRRTRPKVVRRLLTLHSARILPGVARIPCERATLRNRRHRRSLQLTHSRARADFNRGCVGQFWKAQVGKFSQAPKAGGSDSFKRPVATVSMALFNTRKYVVLSQPSRTSNRYSSSAIL
jgi:hypothetical protein